jgi:pSer/pThr/pTyr-binding forkhead associated (FHA) protein
LDAASNVILQFLPSGTCVSVPLQKPLVLGRGLESDVESTLDLTDFGAFEHGVSRRHCQLQRRGCHLRAMDLGSTNGPSLNGQPMLPHREYQISHGDRLALGALPILVSFGGMRSDPA